MTKDEKYAYWLMLSDYDLGTIDCLIEGKRWAYVAYLCQQAIERQLKGMYMYYNEAEPPKTHNNCFLFHKIQHSAKFKPVSETDSYTRKRQYFEDFIIDVMYYYISDYPFSYKNITNRFVGREIALPLYEQTKECVKWLRAMQPEVEIPKPNA